MKEAEKIICKVPNCEYETNTCGVPTHLKYIHKLTSKEYYDLYLKTEQDGKCIYCGNPTKYRKGLRGYKPTCGEKPCFDKYCDERRIETNLKRRGVRYPMEDKEVREKSEQTNLKNHGVKYNSQRSDTKANVKKTRDSDWNGKWFNREKFENTMMNEYGDIGFGSKELRDKANETIKQKYNVESNISQNPEIQEKTQQTFKDKWDGRGFGSEIINKSIEDTNEILYGNRVAMRSEIVKDNLRDTWAKQYYKILVSTDRLKNLVKPLFTEEEFKGCRYNYEFECCRCHETFEAIIKNGGIPKCPKCYPKFTSIAETEIYDFIKNILPNLEIIRGDRKQIYPKEIDIFIPELKIGFEYDSFHYHSYMEGAKDEFYHAEKTNSCEKKGIHLIHIFEDEWLSNQNLVKKKIEHIVGKNQSQKIYARNCIIKEISFKEAEIFLNKYHLRGSVNSDVYLGAIYKDELISVMSFNNLQNINNQYEMSRFASNYNFRCIGLGGKLLKFFIKKYCPIKLINYADRRWTQKHTNLYTCLNFTLLSILEPDYWYIIDKERVSRDTYAKSKLKDLVEIYDENLTENQIMWLNGYDWIYDCGTLKYELTFQ